MNSDLEKVKKGNDILPGGATGENPPAYTEDMGSNLGQREDPTCPQATEPMYHNY